MEEKLQKKKNSPTDYNLLSNLVNNRSEGIHKINCEYGHNDKKCELRS